MPADVHHVFNETLDRLLFPLFSLKTFAKRIYYGLGQRFSGALRKHSR
jgi:hypothetical protein